MPDVLEAVVAAVSVSLALMARAPRFRALGTLFLPLPLTALSAVAYVALEPGA